jgi:hypothetical protein
MGGSDEPVAEVEGREPGTRKRSDPADARDNKLVAETGKRSSLPPPKVLLGASSGQRQEIARQRSGHHALTGRVIASPVNKGYGCEVECESVSYQAVTRRRKAQLEAVEGALAREGRRS